MPKPPISTDFVLAPQKYTKKRPNPPKNHSLLLRNEVKPNAHARVKSSCRRIHVTPLPFIGTGTLTPIPLTFFRLIFARERTPGAALARFRRSGRGLLPGGGSKDFVSGGSKPPLRTCSAAYVGGFTNGQGASPHQLCDFEYGDGGEKGKGRQEVTEAIALAARNGSVQVPACVNTAEHSAGATWCAHRPVFEPFSSGFGGGSVFRADPPPPPRRFS